MSNSTYIPTTDAIEPGEHLDSRDIIARIEDLERADDESPLSADDSEELAQLKALADDCEGYSDWEHGEQLIRTDSFVSYIEDLIKDCYELPKDMDSGKWPFCHLVMDYEAAAKQAEDDYSEVRLMGHDYFIRNG